MNELTDAQLVAGIVAGRRDDFATLYDRYADALYDVARSMLRDPHDAADAVQDVFVIAAQRLHQLREPERVRAWLFSVLRHDVYRRSAKRRRTTPTDTVAERAAPTMPEEAAGRLEYDDLARLVRDAAEGLDDRDRLVLELSVRQGLQGADLASALGVSADQSYSLVFRMRERAERSLGALVVARSNRAACPALDDVLRDWDGRFSVLVRKRVARHIDQCDTCESQRKKVGVLAAFAAAPAWAAPLALRERVLAGFAGTASPGDARDAGNGGEVGEAGDAVDVGGSTALDPTSPVGSVTTASDLTWAADGFPGAVRAARRGAPVLVLAVVVIALVVVGAVGVLAARRDAPATLVAGSVESRATTTTTAQAALASTTEVTAAGASVATPTTTAAPGTAPAPTTTIAAPSTTGAGSAAPTSGAVPSAPSTAPPGTPTTAAPPPSTAGTPTTAPPTTAGATTTAPAPPRLFATPGRVDVGTAASTTFTVRNDGGSTLVWSVATTAGPLRPQPTSGTLAPGATASITVAVDRSGQPEGDLTGALTFGGNGGSANVAVVGRVERGPTVSISTTPSPLGTMYTPSAGCVPVTASISAVVADESRIGSVALHWRGPGGAPASSVPMTLRVDRWVAPLGPFTAGGALEWWVRATDARGNVTTTPLRTLTVGATCIR